MQGLHLTADLYDCRGADGLMTDAAVLAGLCRRHTTEVGLTLVDEKWYTFAPYNGQPGGVTGMLLLAESHLAVHTWPERRAVTLDVYVCNFTTDNSDKANALLREIVAAFQPGRCELHRLERGREQRPPAETILEPLNDAGDAVYGFVSDERVLFQRTPFQTIEIVRTPRFGLAMRIDGHFMTSEGEEFFYHEALVHPAAVAHGAPRQVLIIGGGDGGAAEEVLKHRSVERVVLAELDAEVIAVAKAHLQRVHRGVFDDPRLQVRIGDGLEYVATTPDRFDLILLDLTDPETPAGSLYTEAFFRSLTRIMNPAAAVVLHTGTPVFEPEQVRSINAALRKVFEQVHPFGLYVPLYGAYWGLSVASHRLDPRAIDAATLRARAAALPDLRYYNEDVHHALFALPNYYRALVGAMPASVAAEAAKTACFESAAI
ncbi:MAG: polyamine aminopropyltransferase [Tepidimonas sp.]|uniref:polyamine aminopropyltransferase n=1 Tax=Tepidimonas sp. TaxID=2002775 RepID=UPI0040551FEB